MNWEAVGAIAEAISVIAIIVSLVYVAVQIRQSTLQLSRGVESRHDKRPMLSDLRDSGAIEQDADVVWMLRRPCVYATGEDAEDRTLAIVDVAKQRNGRVGEVELNFEENFTRFRDRARGVDDKSGIVGTGQQVVELVRRLLQAFGIIKLFA